MVPPQMRLVILLPVYNDWSAAATLLDRIDVSLANAGLSARVLFVDDCSTLRLPNDFAAGTYRAVTAVRILNLRRNVGHQRAILLGLAYQHSRGGYDAVLIMDADGEDRAEDVPRLVEAFEQAERKKIIFAERRRRTESLTFRAFYWLYRQMHLVLTGLRVRVGNFSIMPVASVASLMAVPEAWNHVTAAVFKSKLAYDTIPTTRGVRIAGHSSMNFVALVVHGLSALSVFGEIVGVRLLVASTAMFLAVAGIAAGLCGWSMGSSKYLPSWVIAGATLGLLLLSQLMVVSFLAALAILSARNEQHFLPLAIGGFSSVGPSDWRSRQCSTSAERHNPRSRTTQPNQPDTTFRATGPRHFLRLRVIVVLSRRFICFFRSPWTEGERCAESNERKTSRGFRHESDDAMDRIDRTGRASAGRLAGANATEQQVADCNAESPTGCRRSRGRV